MKKQAAYKKVYQELKADILNKSYPIGSLLPPEPALCKEFDVSRTTVRKAMELLQSEKFVKIQQGKGTEVLNYKTSQSLNRITSFTQTLLDKGYEVKTKDIHISLEVPDKEVLNSLKLNENTAVIKIQRIQLADEQPIALITNYLVPDLVPGIQEHKIKIVSLYKFLEEKYGIVFNFSEDNITATVADFTQAHLLNLPVGSPLLVDTRISYSKEKAVEYVVMIVDASKFSFQIKLYGDKKGIY